MLFDVYIYKDDPVDALSTGPSTGELVLKNTGRDNGVMAYLYVQGTKTHILDPMRHVRLVAMNNGSFVIEGTRTVADRPSAKSKVTSFHVQWVIKHVGAPAVLDAKRLLKRSALRLSKAASGFDPIHDDRID